MELLKFGKKVPEIKKMRISRLKIREKNSEVGGWGKNRARAM